MKYLIIVLLMLLLVSSLASFNPIINEEMITRISLEATTWKPAKMEDNPLAKKQTFEVLKMLGSKGMMHEPDREFIHTSNDDIPESFNALEQWSDCMLPALDQQFCGADWAYIAVEILSERICIASNGTQKVMLSVNDILSCDEKDWGCSGGYPNGAWDYMADEGIVTEECFPFESRDGHKMQCPYSSTCYSGADVEYKKYRSTQYNMFSSEESIQTEIMKNGPVQTEFQVYADFLNYGSGIYQHITGGKLGFYSSKIVGWGVENSTKYWIAASVFGEEWGEKGYFKILRGENHCNFESSTLAGTYDSY
jgi:cathepsin B